MMSAESPAEGAAAAAARPQQPRGEAAVKLGLQLLRAARSGNEAMVMQILMQEQLPVNVEVAAPPAAPSLPVHWAAFHGMLPALQRLQQRGARLDIPDARGHTPLFYACHAGKIEAVRWLVQEAGAAVTPTTNAAGATTGATMDPCRPLQPALVRGNLSVLRFLLDRMVENGGDGSRPADTPLWLDKDDTTPLSFAVREGNCEVIRVLVQEYGADVNRVASVGPGAALHTAAFAGKLEVAQTLIELGATIDLQNRQGRTALAIAAERGVEPRTDNWIEQFRDLALCLLDKGANSHLATTFCVPHARAPIARLVQQHRQQQQQQAARTPTNAGDTEATLPAPTSTASDASDATMETKQTERANESPTAVAASIPDTVTTNVQVHIPPGRQAHIRVGPRVRDGGAALAQGQELRQRGSATASAAASAATQTTVAAAPDLGGGDGALASTQARVTARPAPAPVAVVAPSPALAAGAAAAPPPPAPAAAPAATTNTQNAAAPTFAATRARALEPVFSGLGILVLLFWLANKISVYAEQYGAR